MKPNTGSMRALLGAAWLAAALTSGCVSVAINASSDIDPPANLGQLKSSLRHYHDSGAYERGVTAAAALAQQFVQARAGQVSRPALVLDIDETALSNWPQMVANDFGYFADGPCEALPRGPCGALAWEASGRAQALPAILALYRAARAHNVAVFFITGRREGERAATEANLRAAGYAEWTEVVLRAATSHTPSASDYKSAERARIEAAGYTIIANVGDQQSDLDGGHAERTFKLPNPFYFLP